MTELVACALVVIACAVVVARCTRGAMRALLLASLFGASGAAAALRPRTTPLSTGNVPKSSGAIGYVGSAACLPCHASEHASFGRTWHRTMTQAASDKTVLAPFERRPDGVFYEGKRVVMTTGSHREQAYWTDGERGDLAILPVVWMVEAQKLLPRREAFVFPPNEEMPAIHWGSSCIACHAVAGEPRRDKAQDRWDTRVAELGIACEACHGPGGEHVTQYRDPVARYTHPANRHIVQPAKLDHDRANAVCGQCHAYAYPRDEAAWWQTGYALSFRAGDALAPSRIMLSPAVMGDAHGPEIDTAVESIFWPDGDVRVGGREFNGLSGSKCKATCVDCHSMHEGDPAGQLKPNVDCTTRCHTSNREKHHTHHTVAIACVDCHMPKTSFALLGGVRSHRIAIPNAMGGDAKPSACELCHLDKAGSGKVAFALRAGLSGDAGTRALVADALGRFPNGAFAAPILDAMAKDPYPAVRFVAARSRACFPGVFPPLDVANLVEQRDDRPVTIAE